MQQQASWYRINNLFFLFAALVAFIATPLCAQASNEARETEIKAAYAAAEKVMQRGPADIKLRDQATLKLPAGYLFVPTKEGNQLLHAMGNRASDTLLGLVFPGVEQAPWFLVVRYLPEGYIKDDEAKDWNADELLQSLKDGTEEMNKERRTRGIPELDVIGWVEKPHYDVATHQLVWALSSRQRGSTGEPQGVNYNTYALGREGYISMNLITDYNLVEAHKPQAKMLLAALQYSDGKRYADFNESTDKVAAYGLTALVAGAAAKKLGLFAVAGAFLLKFWKILAIAFAGGGVALFKRFRKNKPEGNNPPPAA